MTAVHRNGDLRTCGATTITTQSKLSVGGQPVALTGDVNSHGDGQLLPTGNKVTFQGKEVKKVGDDASTDDLGHPDPAAGTGFGKFTIG